MSKYLNLYLRYKDTSSGCRKGFSQGDDILKAPKDLDFFWGIGSWTRNWVSLMQGYHQWSWKGLLLKHSYDSKTLEYVFLIEG